MTHPQPPAGPQDPQHPNTEPPTQSSPTTPPQSTVDPTVAQTPLPPSPWSAAGSASQPPFSGTAYPSAGGGFAGAGGGYPAPGGPLVAPAPVPTQGSKKTVVAVAITAAVLTLLTCAGGIVAVVIGANRAAHEVTEALPTPGVTRGAALPSAKAPSSTASGDTRNMSPGDTLVIDGDGGTIEITVTKFSTATKPCAPYGLKPDEGMYVIADVTLTVTRGTASANPLFFEWVAADGTEANAVAGAFSGCGEPMPSADDLTAGTRRTGSVVFDVHDTSGVLEYQHRFETAGSWKP
ncbi:DUF4352 domain-containing protein [Micromonospora sp. LAH09]|uniref:DUF4352 domain-containing protein n=1 Tax=Micromonospora cabrerizensis TaxID=2911213 RepID=UPI001EE7D8CD|nr:DUF4352 domain-containing protein [Micromonospora cabrerizensis]MCG5470506.1 DUF4352 domain-containing protein [Micromonospora cabrerizensis]